MVLAAPLQVAAIISIVVGLEGCIACNHAAAVTESRVMSVGEAQTVHGEVFADGVFLLDFDGTFWDAPPKTVGGDIVRKTDRHTLMLEHAGTGEKVSLHSHSGPLQHGCEGA